MPTLNLEDKKLAQRCLNELTGSALFIDGQLGPATTKVVKMFQFDAQLDVTGEIDDETWELLKNRIDIRFVRQDDIITAAKKAGIQPSVLLAIAENESIGSGFYPSGRCIILFERHKFYQYAKQRYDVRQAEAWRAKYPNLCHPVWDQKAYFGGEREWDRYMAAANLDGTVAALATSWGMFQIMGFNFRVAGFDTIDQFVTEMNVSEHSHLAAVMNFMQNQPQLWSALKRRDFATIARVFNGPRYAENKYDVKLRNADARFQKFNQ